jgi:hypothetical protein
MRSKSSDHIWYVTETYVAELRDLQVVTTLQQQQQTWLPVHSKIDQVGAEAVIRS